MRRFSLFVLCLVFAGCAMTGTKLAELGLSDKEIYVPKYPVIFIHGLGYTGKYWEESEILKELKRLRWDYGGELKVKVTDGAYQVEPALISPAHIYAITFSDKQMAIIQQGRELAEVIRRVKEFNRSDKVILVGHSMGGLAAREYMQSGYYGNDVASLVTVGTPHRGSAFDVEKLTIKIIPRLFRDFVWEVDVKSDAVRDLRPKSIYLEGGPETESPDRFASKDINLNGVVGDTVVGLNDIQSHPLPTDVRYVSVIGSGCPFISTRQQCSFSDGIVRINSQDLNKVPGVNVKAETLMTEKDHFDQANDSLVLIKAIKPLLVKIA